MGSSCSSPSHLVHRDLASFSLVKKTSSKVNRLYAKLIYANNRLTAKLILKDIAASTKRLCTAFVYNSQGSNGVQNIISKLFKHYKLLTKGRLAVRYAKTIHKSLKA